MFHKAIKNVETKLDNNGRELTAYASTFGNVDRANDRVIKGAFSKTIAEGFDAPIKNGRPSKIKVLWQHDSRMPFGIPKHIEEDSTGLLTVTTISNTQENKDRIEYIKDGVVSQMSIGYTPIKSKQAEDLDNVYDLTELELHEYSAVTFACNEAADILGIKRYKAIKDQLHKTGEANPDILDMLLNILTKANSIQFDTKDVIKYQDLKLADRDSDFDPTEAIKHVDEWADVLVKGPEEKYFEAFLYFNTDSSDNKSAYKIQIGDIVNEKLLAIPKAIFEAANIINENRLELSEKDINDLKKHLSKYYKKMRKQFDDDTILEPWKEKTEELDFASLNDMVFKCNGMLESLIEKTKPGKTTLKNDEPIGIIELNDYNEKTKSLVDKLG
jgi:HK97 family phage prohead protease